MMIVKYYTERTALLLLARSHEDTKKVLNPGI